MLTATDPLRHVTTYGYDTHGNVTSITTPSPAEGVAASVTHFTYDTGGTGLLTQVTLDVGGQIVTAIITRQSSEELGLKMGMSAYALIKATEVMIAIGPRKR